MTEIGRSQINKMRKLYLAVLAAGLSFLNSANASLTVVIGIPNPSEIVNIVVTPGSGSTVPAYNGGVYAGIYNQTINGVASSGFCIDVAHDVYSGETFNNYNYANLIAAPASPAGPMNATQVVEIEKLWAAYFTSAKSSALDAAALQVAIWEALGNGAENYTVTEGAHNTTSDQVFALAGTYLSSLSSLTAEAGLIAIVSPTGQSYVIVPEATTMIMGAMLLLPLGYVSMQPFVRKMRAANGK
jgi:hypothetical protein